MQINIRGGVRTIRLTKGERAIFGKARALILELEYDCHAASLAGEGLTRMAACTGDNGVYTPAKPTK